jgi:hypothetical protein
MAQCNRWLLCHIATQYRCQTFLHNTSCYCIPSHLHPTRPPRPTTNTEHDEIVELLTSSGATFSPYQAAWLKALTTTTAADDAEAAAAHTQAGSKPTQQQHQQPLVPDFLPPSSEQYPHIYMGDVRPQPAADPDRVSFRALQMDEQELWAAVGECVSSWCMWVSCGCDAGVRSHRCACRGCSCTPHLSSQVNCLLAVPIGASYNVCPRTPQA